MSLDLWKYLDPRGMGITLALSAILVATVLLLTDRVMDHRQKGLRLASIGVICAALGVVMNMLQDVISNRIGVFLGIVWILGGLGLILGGVLQLRGQRVPWWRLGVLWTLGVGVGYYFGVAAPDVRWRIGLLSIILSFEAAWLARVATTESRPAYRQGMALLATFGVVFSVLMGLRAMAAGAGYLSSSVSLSLVNAGSVIAGGMALIGGVVGLVFILAGNLKSMLEYQAQHDPLTGLLNRQGLRRWLNAQNPSTHLAIAQIDLDHFKSVNDRFGHAVGDAVLERLGRLLETHRMDSEVAIRMGGEEFLVLSASAQPDHALVSRIEALREAMATDPAPPQVTFSAGVALGQVATFEAALRRADTALYQAKAGGRNRVVVDHTTAAG